MSVVEASRFAQVRSPAEIPTQLTVHHPCARRHIFPVESRSRRYRCLWESPACCETAPSGGKATLDLRRGTGHTGISRPGGKQQGGKMGLRDHTDPTASLSRDPGGACARLRRTVPVGTRYRREGPEVGAWLRGSAAERGRGHRRLRSRPREDEQGLGKVSARTRCVRSRAEQAAPSHGTQARCRGWPRLCGSGTQATRSEGLLWLSSGSRGDADPGFGFGFGLRCLSARSQIV